mgnify:CR=1 FL=1
MYSGCYIRVYVDNELYDIESVPVLDKNKRHNIEVVVDRIMVKDEARSRIFESIESASKLSNGMVLFNVIGGEEFMMSENYACLKWNFSMPPLETRLFSFNSPYGACPECNGLGMKMKVSEDLIIPDRNKTIREGGISTLSMDQNTSFTAIETVADYYDIDLDAPIKKIPKEKNRNRKIEVEKSLTGFFNFLESREVVGGRDLYGGNYSIGGALDNDLWCVFGNVYCEWSKRKEEVGSYRCGRI